MTIKHAAQTETTASERWLFSDSEMNKAWLWGMSVGVVGGVFLGIAVGLILGRVA